MYFGQISDLIHIYPLVSHCQSYVNLSKGSVIFRKNYCSLETFWSDIGPYSPMSNGFHFHCYVKSSTVWVICREVIAVQISKLIPVCPLESHFHCYVSLDIFLSDIALYSHISIGIPLQFTVMSNTL